MTLGERIGRALGRGLVVGTPIVARTSVRLAYRVSRRFGDAVDLAWREGLPRAVSAIMTSATLVAWVSRGAA